MKIKTFLFGSILIGLLAGLVSRPSRLERELSEVVLVETETGWGSAVTVKRSGHIFAWTAAHVVDKSAKVQVHKTYRHNGGKAGRLTCDAHVIAILPGVDAALLVIDGDPARFSDAVFASDSPVKPGTEVSHVGNVLGPKFDTSYFFGVVSQNGIRVDSEQCLLDQANLAVAPGCSGGPVFDSGGKVIGLVAIYVGPGISLYVPNREIDRVAASVGVSWAIHGFFSPSDKAIQTAIEARERAVAKLAKPDPNFLELLFGDAPEKK